MIIDAQKQEIKAPPIKKVEFKEIKQTEINVDQ